MVSSNKWGAITLFIVAHLCAAATPADAVLVRSKASLRVSERVTGGENPREKDLDTLLRETQDISSAKARVPAENRDLKRANSKLGTDTRMLHSYQGALRGVRSREAALRRVADLGALNTQLSKAKATLKVASSANDAVVHLIADMLTHARTFHGAEGANMRERTEAALKEARGAVAPARITLLQRTGVATAKRLRVSDTDAVVDALTLLDVNSKSFPAAHNVVGGLQGKIALAKRRAAMNKAQLRGLAMSERAEKAAVAREAKLVAADKPAVEKIKASIARDNASIAKESKDIAALKTRLEHDLSGPGTYKFDAHDR